MLREYSRGLDAQLAELTAQYDIASVTVVNLELELEERSQQWEEERSQKDCECSTRSVK